MDLLLLRLLVSTAIRRRWVPLLHHHGRTRWFSVVRGKHDCEERQDFGAEFPSVEPEGNGCQWQSAFGRQLGVSSTSPASELGSSSTVNPGVTIQATVPFRLATGDTIKSLQLHDSAFSGGVTVKVS